MDGQLVPSGEYEAKIVDSGLTESDGIWRVWFVYLITHGEYAGERIRSSLMLEVPEGSSLALRRAEQIGHRAFFYLRLACGVDHPSDSEELHNIPLGIRVGIVKARPARSAGQRDNLGRFLPSQTEVKKPYHHITNWKSAGGAWVVPSPFL